MTTPTVTKAAPAAPKTATPQTLGFLLLDNFTLISLASAIEPLRMANQLAGRELYRWYTLSQDGLPIHASDGVQVTPDASIAIPLTLDWVVVCGGVGANRSISREHVSWLQSQTRQLRRMGAVCTGSWALARAGLLDGFEASVHWECLAAMKEAFPRIALSARLFSIDRNRFTASGGTAPLDMMLTLIGRDHGHDLSAAISEMFIYERVRNEQDHQRMPLKHMLGTTQPKLLEIVALMEANLEEPIGFDELAAYVDISRRQLERLFQKYLHCSPSRYYLRLRLTRARQFLKQTSMPIIDVASACGFVSTPHFSKCYREFYGVPPRQERLYTRSGRELQDEQGRLAVVPDMLEKEPISRAVAALASARGESTYASVPLR
ncbi:GlxA family transcriptional regulator [Halomonas sp. PR-M31]|uniref:choline metabolism transcriptional regulator GbdR n=1 Tax=Halomonas sp. PR-M31 TaxID=1471202 RepID=UPI0006513546|nr:GlxA family transcriptional regulator [Halomonas sp. PR-M31]